MAKSKVKEVRNFHAKPKAKRKGVHSKSKASRSKNSKNYLKRNVGQG
jgi:hypothetical protein